MKLSILIFLFFSFNLNTIKSQTNKTKNWIFGVNNCIKFNDTGINKIDGIKLNTWEGCSSISDDSGNLVLYSDGKKIWNKYHNVIKNGENLLGDISSTQSVLIINHSENDSIYYVFTTPYAFDYNLGLNYNIVNIKSNKDSGEVVLKNILLHRNSSEKLNATNHTNGKDIWIVGHEYGNNNFYTYLLKKDGIVKCPIISNQGFVFSGNQFINQGNLKFSNDGKMLVNTQLFNSSNEYIELFFFNNFSGQLKFNKRISNLAGVYGAEFSPNNMFLYLSETNKIQQIDLRDYSINNIFSYSTFRRYNSLQIGNNNKIYISQNDSNALGVINSPNLKSNNCNFNSKGLLLSNKSKFGLPNFNQSYFFTPSINYKYEMNCIKNSIQFWGKDTFAANSHTWQARKLFGVNGYLLIGSNKDINYTFTDTGAYEVRYIASNGNKADTIVKTIVLYNKINKDYLGKDTTYFQGDVISKTLFAPTPNHCVRWWFSKDLTPALSKGEGASIVADSIGKYICKVTNQAFCEVWDTITINECINNLQQPSLFRSRDTLRTWHINADSFVWYRNNQLYKITKEPYLALTETGNYRVEAAKKGHCNSSSIGQLLVNKLSVLGVRIEDLGIRVFPNPSNGIISIESQNPFKLKINTVLGQVFYEGENINNIHLPKGVYFLHFEISGYRSVEKVVVW